MTWEQETLALGIPFKDLTLSRGLEICTLYRDLFKKDPDKSVANRYSITVFYLFYVDYLAGSEHILIFFYLVKNHMIILLKKSYHIWYYDVVGEVCVIYHHHTAPVP